MSLNHGSLEIVTDGLVLCLDAANPRSYPKSGTTWSDLAGANDGTLTNGPTFDADDKGSIVFDGANDYVDLGTSASISTSSAFSLDCWVNLTSYGGNYPSIIQLKTNTSNGWNVSLSESSSYRGIVFGSSSTWSRLKTDNPPSVGNWHHISIIYDTSNYSVYLNLSLQGLTTAGGFNSTTQNNYLGSTNQAARGATDTWNGYISNVKLYNRAISAGEVLQNYEATIGRYI
jgi:hypothetical protein